MEKHSFVMMMDDDQSILNILTRVLEMEGDSHSSNVQEVLRQLGQCHPNMVIIDLQTPDLENPEILQALKDGSGSPAIMLTAKCEVTTLREALSACSSRDSSRTPPGETVGSVLSKLRTASPGVIATN